jgi:glycosyltransferase involved in cell wall biosynthesis
LTSDSFARVQPQPQLQVANGAKAFSLAWNCGILCARIPPVLMKLAFSTARPSHVVLPANLLASKGHAVTIYNAAYRARFARLRADVQLRFAPQFGSSMNFLTGLRMPRPIQRADTWLYDQAVAIEMGRFDVFWGWATGSLTSARKARRLGASFVLDRACPHVDVQQAMLREQSEMVGVPYTPEPEWFRERQLAEYEEADVILVPSNYTARSFPQHLQTKLLLAPLFGRVGSPKVQEMRHKDEFVVGTVGGQPLRKGHLYLLEAWLRLDLPNARLLLRSDADLEAYPALRDLLHRAKNVERVPHLRNMSEFYHRCDVFVLPAVDEGFGMALLEAMAHGVPSIATTHCGAAELLRPNEDALILAPGNVDALAAAIESLYASAELRHHLAQQGRRTVQTLEANGEYSLYSAALDTLTERILRQQKKTTSAA